MPNARVISAMLFGALCFPIQAKRLHVSPSGNDATGDGTASKPWNTVNKCIGAARAGDTIWVQPGAAFAENIDFSSGAGGSAGAPVVLTSDRVNRATLTSSARDEAGLTLRNIGHVTISICVSRGRVLRPAMPMACNSNAARGKRQASPW